MAGKYSDEEDDSYVSEGDTSTNLSASACAIVKAAQKTGKSLPLTYTGLATRLDNYLNSSLKDNERWDLKLKYLGNLYFLVGKYMQCT